MIFNLKETKNGNGTFWIVGNHTNVSLFENKFMEINIFK